MRYGVVLFRHLWSGGFWIGNSDMFPVSICEEQVLIYPVCCWKWNWTVSVRWLDFLVCFVALFLLGKLFWFFFGNLMKSSPVSSVKCSSHRQSRRQWVNHWASLQKASCPTFLFLFSTQTCGCFFWLWRLQVSGVPQQKLWLRLRSGGQQWLQLALPSSNVRN